MCHHTGFSFSCIRHMHCSLIFAVSLAVVTVFLKYRIQHQVIEAQRKTGTYGTLCLLLWWRNLLTTIVRMRESMNCQQWVRRAFTQMPDRKISRSKYRQCDWSCSSFQNNGTRKVQYKDWKWIRRGTRVGNDRLVVEWQCAYADDPVCRSLTFCL